MPGGLWRRGDSAIRCRVGKGRAGDVESGRATSGADGRLEEEVGR